MIVFLIVVFFGSDPVGVLLPKEFTNQRACVEHANLITLVAPVDTPARAYCVGKKVEERA